jgi:hypothetical protein
MAAVPSGSYLVIAFPTTEVKPEESLAAARSWNETAEPKIHLRTRADLERLYDRLELLEPGAVPCTRWRPDGDPAEIIDVYQHCAVGRKY